MAFENSAGSYGYYQRLSVMKNLYIHIPFCRSKCDYCAFYSETGCTEELKHAYIKRIGDELHKYDCSQIETVYIGGGTPTLLTVEQLEKLFDILHDRIAFNQLKECSIESNPETLDADKIALLHDCGVSRLSMGVQSFSENHRRTLGRRTSQTAIENALEITAANPFKHFNIDLIYGIPFQTPEDFRADLKRVKEAGCDHFSAYNLTIEEQTALAGEAIELDEDIACMMYEAAGSAFPFKRYEISNYALNDEAQCRHNKNVWSGETLLGIGAAASSFDGIDRWTQQYDIEAFLNGDEPEYDIIDAELRRMEIFAVNLRTVRGWQRAEWEKKFPFSWNLMLQKVENIAKLYDDCFVIERDVIRLNDKGLQFWNEIASELL
ncbi:MAG: radical SAM family heme chaperone HemW [Lentisphaeria bacterium]|nr:radical SAM family heme chaperone HemW [Lentisphaeria bacterium]